jgi:hypothetical protein
LDSRKGASRGSPQTMEKRKKNLRLEKDWNKKGN